jgi:hypothetical protein
MRARVEIAVASLLAIVAALLHVVFFRAAGAFWRDEAITIRIAMSPSLAAMMQRFYFDSAFLLSTGALRLWIAVTGAAPDAIRVFGFVAGVAVLISACFAVRQLGGRIPLIALAILGTNAAVIRYGDSIRGYGVSMLAGLLAFALIGRAARTGERRDWFVALAAAVLSVHATYQNSVLVFAACVAASYVVERRNAWKPLAVGAASATSLLIYGRMLAARVNDIFRSADVTLADYCESFLRAGGVALAVVLVALIVRRRADYLAITVLLFVGVHFVYLRWVGYTPQPWYFTLPIAVIAVAADVDLAVPPLWRAAVAAMIVAVSLPRTAATIPLRQTNIDDAAAVVSRDARPGDFVVVYPWYIDTSFSLYYHGAAAWQSLPPVADHSVQRLDLAARAVMTPGIERPVVARVAAALQTGHRVWLVGFPLFKERPLTNDPRRFTRIEAADLRWCSALARVLGTARSRELVVQGTPDVMVYERVNVVRFE